MDASFWHRRWELGEIGFHQSQPNPFLVSHLPKLNLSRGATVLLPLCGKTHDIAWLLANGYRVVGVELSPLAINELFQELGITPEIVALKNVQHYFAPNLDLYVGDIFEISASHLGTVDAIYDRAALVALPADTRTRYVAHLTGLTGAAPQLLITYQYDASLIDGPPFSVDDDEIERLFGAQYQLNPVEHRPVEGGLKGRVASAETAWLLRPAHQQPPL